MTLNIDVIFAIAAMAIATGFTRLSGAYLVGLLTVKGRLKAALDALPPAILVAVIAPTVLTTGVPESGAAAITIAAAWARLPLLLVIIIGVAAIVTLRALL